MRRDFGRLDEKAEIIMFERGSISPLLIADYRIMWVM